MRNYLRFVLFCSVLYLMLPYAVNAVNAAHFEFDKSALSVKNGDTFTLQVIVDPKTEQITSVDIYVLYDKSILTAQTVDAGTYFPTILDDIQPGKIYIAGLVEDPTAFKTGKGTVATITFKATADGTANVTFDCRSASDSSKIIKNDINATNIITCADNKSSLVTVGTISSLPTTSGGTNGSTTTDTSGATLTPTPTGTVTPTPSPTNTPTPTSTSTISATLVPPVSGNADTAMGLLIPGVLFMLFAGALKFAGKM